MIITFSNLCHLLSAIILNMFQYMLFFLLQYDQQPLLITARTITNSYCYYTTIHAKNPFFYLDNFSLQFSKKCAVIKNLPDRCSFLHQSRRFLHFHFLFYFDNSLYKICFIIDRFIICILNMLKIKFMCYNSFYIDRST